MTAAIDQLIDTFVGPAMSSRLLSGRSLTDAAAAAAAEAGEFQTKLLATDPALARDPGAAAIAKAASGYVQYAPVIARRLHNGNDERAHATLVKMCREIADNFGSYFGARYSDHRGDFLRAANLVNYLATRLQERAAAPPSEADFQRWIASAGADGATRKYVLKGQSVSQSAGGSFWRRLFRR